MTEPASPEPGRAPEEGGTFSQQLQHSPVCARLPDHLATGTFATGVIAMEAADEFVLDFIQGLTRPPRIGARVVLPPKVMAQFMAALQENFRNYEKNFGPPKPLPHPPQANRPSIQEMYQELRLADGMLSGAYANSVLIGHSPSDFFFDFITRFYPTAAVSSRVYMSASQVPTLINALHGAWKNHLQRTQNPPPAPPGQ